MTYRDESLEHEVELSYICEIVAAAYGTRDILLSDVSDEIVRLHTFNGYVGYIVLLVPVLNEVVGSLSCLALLAVDQRIGETAYVAGCFPCSGVHDDGSVETYVIRALLNELLPPCCLYVVLKLYSERAVVP